MRYGMQCLYDGIPAVLILRIPPCRVPAFTGTACRAIPTLAAGHGGEVGDFKGQRFPSWGKGAERALAELKDARLIIPKLQFPPGTDTTFRFWSHPKDILVTPCAAAMNGNCL